MPAWVLLLTKNLLDVSRLESDVRHAGYSPRTAPDLARMRVLLRQGEEPRAAIVDLVSTGEDGLAAIRELTPATRVVAVVPEGVSDVGRRAERDGAQTVEAGEADAVLRLLIAGEDGT